MLYNHSWDYETNYIWKKMRVRVREWEWDKIDDNKEVQLNINAWVK